MKRITIRYGLIGGLIIAGLMVISGILARDSDYNFSIGQLIGYASMIVALSTIFFGIRSYKEEMGEVSFVQGFKIGLIITLIASVFYVAVWMIYSSTAAGVEMMDAYFAYQEDKLRSSGKSAAEIDEQLESMRSMMERYNHPVVKIGITFLEIFPVGLVISLISALILRTRRS